MKKRQQHSASNKVVAYMRVSTARQADEGHSLAAQKEKLVRYAELYNLEIVAFEVDAGVSASSLNRPALNSAFARMDHFEAAGLLVVKLDRLTRSVRDLCTIVENYFQDGTHRLLSAGEQIDTGTANGRMMLNMLTTIAQWERETICERTAAVMRHMKGAGKYTGGFPPFGFYVNDEGELVEHAQEQSIIHVARAYSANGWSLRKIAERVGLNPRTGKPFSASQIQGMLGSE